MVITACLHEMCLNFVGENSTHPQYPLCGCSIRDRVTVFHLSRRVVFCHLGIAMKKIVLTLHYCSTCLKISSRFSVYIASCIVLVVLFLL